jgi:hypothetical protein
MHHGAPGSQTINQSHRYCTVISLYQYRYRYRYSLNYDLLIQVRPSPLAPFAARWRSAFGGMFGEISWVGRYRYWYTTVTVT